MKHTVELNSGQLELIRDLLSDRLEDVEEDLKHLEEHPEAINEDLEPGEEPVTVEDIEMYRDELQTLLSLLPETDEA